MSRYHSCRAAFGAQCKLPAHRLAKELLSADAGAFLAHPAFLDLPLPSADGKRETLLMAPVRVKSGLSENLALGRALHVGSTVTLVVDAPELVGPIRRTWRVTGFNVDPPQPGLWTLDLPTRGTREALLVHLHAPLSSTAEAFIAIRGPNGHRVAGVGRLADEETLWQFTPTAIWEGGRYALVTHPELEDPAGNRPCGLFEALVASRVRCAGTVQAFQAVAAKGEVMKSTSARRESALR